MDEEGLPEQVDVKEQGLNGGGGDSLPNSVSSSVLTHAHLIISCFLGKLGWAMFLLTAGHLQQNVCLLYFLSCDSCCIDVGHAF